MKIKFFQTTWWKLLLYFLGIIFLTVVIFGISVSRTLRDITGGPYREIAIGRTRRLAEAIASANTENKNIKKGDIPFSSLGKLSGVSITILDFNGKEVLSSHSKRHIDIKLSEQDISQLKKGKDIIQLKPSTKPDRRALYTASPIINNGTIKGFVLLTVPVAAPEEVRKKMGRAIFNSLIIAFFFSSLVALFLARTMTKPVEKMEETARSVAMGNFSQRLNLKRQDELGKLGKSLDEMSEKLENQEIQRNQLTSDISHEIRTPLATIQGCSEAILDGVVETEEEKNRYLKTIRDEASRISILLQDLTEISKLETGETSVDLQPFSVKEVVERALSGVEIFASNRNIGLKKELPEESISAVGDEDRIQQVLIILMDNAINHIPAEREVKITVSRVGKLVRFCISDTGDGIPPEDLPHIFERLFKSDKSRTKKGTGSGLGLAIAKQIIKAHGKDISVKSSKKGTSFSFELPLFIG